MESDLCYKMLGWRNVNSRDGQDSLKRWGPVNVWRGLCDYDQEGKPGAKVGRK